jgi:glycosyltransferase involved in cell wall biosynthesis
MVEAFAQLDDLHRAGWRLCIAGGVAPTERGQSYLAEIQAVAVNLPVDVVVNPPSRDLSQLYERASLFWHAAGLALDPVAFPQKMEHFGIATAEAMLAGCVPLVINRGGQPEIVRDGVDGLLWNDVPELLDVTRTVANDPDSRAALAASAQGRAEKFSRAAYVEGFRNRLQGLL